MAVIDIAKDISEGLARMACVAEIDGEVEDLRTRTDKDCKLNILTAKDAEGLAALRHTAKPCYGSGYQETLSGARSLRSVRLSQMASTTISTRDDPGHSRRPAEDRG